MTLVVALVIVSAPAVALRAACVGHSCDEEEDPTSEVPFCSLPADVRAPISAGFEAELHRSPDLLAVTRSNVVTGGTAWPSRSPAPTWPSLQPISRRVPLVFTGPGVDPDAQVPPGTTLDSVAPTLAEAVAFRRANPHVRSGEPVTGVVEEPVPLVVQVAMKGTGSEDLERSPDDWPRLDALIKESGGTLDADTGSLPLDPAAVMTTIGTGGLPNQHGIVGTLVRTNEGEVVRAWGPKTPVSIIATLADDLDEEFGQRSRVGLVRTDVADGGLVGGNWYVEVDKDEVATEDKNPAAIVRRMLDSGYGDDDTPDVIAVALEGRVAAMDRRLGRIEDALNDSSQDWVMAVTATGSNTPAAEADITGREIKEFLETEIPNPNKVIQAVAPGGLYLDQEALADAGITEDDVLEAFARLREAGPVGSPDPIFADAFGAVAVSFSRYC